MNEMPSSQFRREYGKLRKMTTVTVNGHPIGTWIPSTEVFAPEEVPPLEDIPLPTEDEEKELSGWNEAVRSRQAYRDDLLRKINRGK